MNRRGFFGAMLKAGVALTVTPFKSIWRAVKERPGRWRFEKDALGVLTPKRCSFISEFKMALRPVNKEFVTVFFHRRPADLRPGFREWSQEQKD